MAREFQHWYAQVRRRATIDVADGFAVVRFAANGSFRPHHPGRLSKGCEVTYLKRVWVADVGVDAESDDSRWRIDEERFRIPVEIRTPDGAVFTAETVTMADIRRFRDPRGVSYPWTYSLAGESARIPVDEPGDEHGDRVTAASAAVDIGVKEQVFSRSAPPLVDADVAAQRGARFPVDLWRVGVLRITASINIGPFDPPAPPREVRLIDPDGITVATAMGGFEFDMTLPLLRRSRDAAGSVRLWTIEVMSGPGQTHVSATVVTRARVALDLVRSRIALMLGPNGRHLSIYGEDRGEHMFAMLKILDRVSAETLDMHGVLGGTTGYEPEVDRPYVIGHRLRLLYDDWATVTASAAGIRVSAIDVEIGLSEHTQPPVPALKLTIGVEGVLPLDVNNFPFATNAHVEDGRISVEAGVRVSADGTLVPEVWVQEDPIDIDSTFPGVEYVQGVLNALARARIARELAEALEGVPRILRVLTGGDHDVTALRIEGNDLVVEYVSPVEPDPKPSQEYVAIQGRAATQVGPRAWRFKPPVLADTWEAPNLGKIDHIVVVTMENRSFDHVLGYLAQRDGSTSDGLSADLLAALRAQGFTVAPLGESERIQPNEVGLRTKFPGHPGHDFRDVAEQVSERLDLRRDDGSTRTVTSPEGFQANFERHLRHSDSPLRPEDVLGYHTATDLPFFAFLAENYAYCERYFCSHPGPTLPNRMYALSGDLQYDRSGEAILDNNDGESFVLSRARSIFDLLEQRDVSWRVYESPPSVTMLRMFARYAGASDRYIRSIDRLAADIENEGLPAVTFIDPAMHHFPANDDHPDADMYNGQAFLLNDVYNVLRAHPETWARTLLVITYDEHGGFYDHVPPPLAEARSRPIAVTEDRGPDGNPPPFGLDTVTVPYGPRVPTFLVSPHVPAGKGPDVVLDHTSILKTILVRFCPDRPFLSDRVLNARSLDAYLSVPAPRSVPEPPVLRDLRDDEQLRVRFTGTRIVTEPLTRARMRSGPVDSHALMGMVARMLGR